MYDNNKAALPHENMVNDGKRNSNQDNEIRRQLTTDNQHRSANKVCVRREPSFSLFSLFVTAKKKKSTTFPSGLTIR